MAYEWMSEDVRANSCGESSSATERLLWFGVGGQHVAWFLDAVIRVYDIESDGYIMVCSLIAHTYLVTRCKYSCAGQSRF